MKITVTEESETVDSSFSIDLNIRHNNLLSNYKLMCKGRLELITATSFFERFLRQKGHSDQSKENTTNPSQRCFPSTCGSVFPEVALQQGQQMFLLLPLQRVLKPSGQDIKNASCIARRRSIAIHVFLFLYFHCIICFI